MGQVQIKTQVPGPGSVELLEKWHQNEADVTGYQAQVVWQSAKGCLVNDVDGNVFMDWTSGVLVTNVGHCHPHLVKATQRASEDLLNNYECATPYRIEAAERLVDVLPKPLDKCFFLSTGSEAVEGALRLMKRYTGKYEILSFSGGFHGRTPGAASVGGLGGAKKKYGPTIPGVIRAPYPDPYRDPLGLCDGGPDYKKYFDYLEHIISTNSTGSLAGLIVEPYQGAGGFIFPPEGWLKKLREWAREKGILFTLDEVQASYGRTGKMWAADHEELEPDLLALGKGIGSGVSVSAICSTSATLKRMTKGEMGRSDGGNPVSSAAVTAVLDIFEKENLVENSREMGEYMKGRLLKMAENCPYLGDVRGMGLVMGMEFVKDKQAKEPAPELIRKMIDACAAKGLLVGSVGLYGNVLRVAPPLVITREQADESLAIMGDVLDSLQR